MYLSLEFGNGTRLDVDPVEFGADGMGEIIDRLAAKHGGLKDVTRRESPPPRQEYVDDGVVRQIEEE